MNVEPEGDLHLLDVVGVRKPSGPISLRFAVLPVAENANGDIDTQRFNFLGVRENEKALHSPRNDGVRRDWENEWGYRSRVGRPNPRGGGKGVGEEQKMERYIRHFQNASIKSTDSPSI